MQMIDGLAAIRALVDDDAVALPLTLEFSADLGGRGKQTGLDLAGGFGVELAEVVCVHDGHDQDVRRRLRTQIVKCDDVLVAQHFTRGNLVPDDLAKDAIGHECGLMRLNQSTESGLGMTPETPAFIANGTVV